jgi:transmembrane sensor
MPDDRDIDWTLLTRYVAGECSQGESADVERWLGADPARQEQLDAARRLWDRAATLPPAARIDAMWRDLQGHMRAPEERALTVGKGRGGRRVRTTARRWSWSLIAAASVALIVGWLALKALRPMPVTPQVFASAARQRLDLRLGDGTRVLLAPESRMRLASDFGRQRRDVYVEGEAYFEVSHDSTRPFTVFAANASTRDIGTAFAIRAYADDRAVRVVVREGSVAFSGAGLLAAGDVGRLTAEGQASVHHHANLSALLGWTEGQLVFEDAPLGQVLADLRRWYGVEAQLADSSLGALPFTGSLRHVSPENAIALVAATVGLRVRQAGTHVVLEKP